jgi:hypothetical protein
MQIMKSYLLQVNVQTVLNPTEVLKFEPEKYETLMPVIIEKIK